MLFCQEQLGHFSEYEAAGISERQKEKQEKQAF